MAQVNSSAGQIQVFGNVVVASAVAEVGSSTSTKAMAAAVVVPYSQSEPGKHDPKRS